LDYDQFLRKAKEAKLTDEEIKMLYDKVDKIKAIKNVGESTFTALLSKIVY